MSDFVISSGARRLEKLGSAPIEVVLPCRIQRQRTKGWRMPEGAVYVGRPTKWGNPFWHVARFHGLDMALELFRNLVHGIWNPSSVKDWPESYAFLVYETHQSWLRRMGGNPIEVARLELMGKDLACWCPLDKSCHADLLLKIANV